MYKIRLSDGSLSDIQRLDKRTAIRIMSKIEWLAKNADLVKPLGLRDNLTGFSKLRVGDYRIIYELNANENVLDIHIVGHRSEIYKR